jgi:tape measure domain-containing protein
MGEQNLVQTTFGLRDDVSPALRQIAQALDQFGQRIEQSNTVLVQMAASLQNLQNVQTQTSGSSNQLATATLAVAAALQQQTQAQAQASQASLAYRQQQDQLRETLRQQREAQRAANEEAQRGAEVWRNVLSIAGGTGLATSIQAITQAIINFGKSIVETGARMEQLRISFNAMSGGVQQGVRTFTELFNMSQRLGLSFVPLAEAYRNFSAATRGTNLEGEKTQRIFESVAIAGKALGSSSDEVRRGLLAVEQMVSKGVISMEELRRQLGNALPGAFQIAARAMGMTTAELNDLVKTGTLEAGPFLVKFAEQLRTEFAGGVQTATQSAKSSFERLGNELTLFKEHLANSGLLQIMKDIAEAGTKILENDRKAREARERNLGGPATTLTTDMQLSPRLQEIQAQVDAARKTYDNLTQRLTAKFELFRPSQEDVDKARKAYNDLLKVREEAIKEFQRRLGAETGGAGGAFVNEGAAKVEEAILKRLAEGRKELANIDYAAKFTPGLDVIQEKLKVWQKVMKDVREEYDKLGEGQRKVIAQETAAPHAGNKWRPLIQQLAGERNIDPLLVEALVAQESGFVPTRVSRAGAKGLGQFMPATAEQYGIKGREFDPEANLRATVNYLADLIKQFGGDVFKALTAYNAGPKGGGIPKASGENATFAMDVLSRYPGGDVSALMGVAGSQLTELERARDRKKQGEKDRKDADREAEQMDEERRRNVRLTGKAYDDALDNEIEKREAAIKTLERLRSKYEETKEQRDEDQASLIAGQYPNDVEIQQLSEKVQRLAETRDKYKEEVAALKDRFTALKQNADAQREAEEAEDAFTKKLDDQLKVLRAVKVERTETRLRNQAPGGVVTPDQEAKLQQITTLEKANLHAKQMEDVAKDMARTIEQTFTGMWDQVFSGGVKSFQELGLMVAQSLQKMFAQLASQIMSTLLNAAVTGESGKGGIASVLTSMLTKVATNLITSGSVSVNPNMYSEPIGPGLTQVATGGILPALRSVNEAGFRMRTALAGFQPLAAGGVVSRPSFALISEHPGAVEAVVPLPNKRAIPVTFTNGQGGEQPIVVNVSVNPANVIDPRIFKSSPQEIIGVVAKDVSNDGVTRRVIVQHTR